MDEWFLSPSGAEQQRWQLSVRAENAVLDVKTVSTRPLLPWTFSKASLPALDKEGFGFFADPLHGGLPVKLGAVSHQNLRSGSSLLSKDGHEVQTVTVTEGQLGGAAPECFCSETPPCRRSAGF